ncbi:diguanylate cyclase (GGDEF)-like protein/PAS domain S-box-containing protein [Bosea sp. OAE506]|uniref:EAL domain-containing protein n=1 Tax=Bosea sp. OAE506 TaxID=2663870 RepID=UPI00178A26A2
MDIPTGSLTWSDVIRDIHGVHAGFTPDLNEAIGFYTAESRPVLEAAVNEAFSTGKSFDLELSINRVDGVQRFVRAVGSAEFSDGRPVRLSGALQDVTERRKLSAQLAEQHELMRVTLQSIGDAVITTDATGRITWLNPVAERMTGWRQDESQGKALEEIFRIVDETTRAVAPNPVAACLAEGRIVGLADHTILISKDGTEFGIEHSAAPIVRNDGVVLGVVLVFHDVSEQRRLSKEMKYRATHDALTGLKNRTEFEARLKLLLGKSREDRSCHALLYLDLDQFKIVNDTCGHAVGDILLRQFSRLFRDIARNCDTLARLGGDEFGIILENCSVELAEKLAQRICDAMDDFRFVHDGRKFRVGASIGLVPIDARWGDIAAVQKAADSACYAAKEAGRNRFHGWLETDVAMQSRQFEVQWTNRIERALDDGGFVLHAQTIRALSADKPGLHAELLLRMKSDDGSLAAPGAFLPAAERFHLISRIDRWVLREATRWIASVIAVQDIRLISLNLSGRSIGDRAFHSWAFDVLERAGRDICSRICIEITETEAITNLADAAAFIERVRSMGIKVALDDFGAGASSFGYLKSLRVDFMKIDGRFIRDLVTDKLNDVMVRCFVDIAKVVGVQTVAEFVETSETLDRLRIIGVDYAQGFLLGKPEPLARIFDGVPAVLEPT